MKTNLECVPCFVRQTMDAARFATPDEALHEKILREVLKAASVMDFQEPPPKMGQYIHRLIRKHSCNGDPYREIKDRFNRLVS